MVSVCTVRPSNLFLVFLCHRWRLCAPHALRKHILKGGPSLSGSYKSAQEALFQSGHGTKHIQLQTNILQMWFYCPHGVTRSKSQNPFFSPESSLLCYLKVFAWIYILLININNRWSSYPQKTILYTSSTLLISSTTVYFFLSSFIDHNYQY